MKRQKLQFAVIATALALLASSPAAMAALETYDFTFNSSGGMDASGTITIDSATGVAESGSINVTGVPVEADPSTLITAAGSLVQVPGSPTPLELTDPNGDQVFPDNIVTPLSASFLDEYGLGFGAGQYGGTQYNTLISLSLGNAYGVYEGPDFYTLFVGEAQVVNGVAVPEYVYNWDYGSMTLTFVPEPATYGALAGAGLLLVTLGSHFRRKLA